MSKHDELKDLNFIFTRKIDEYIEKMEAVENRYNNLVKANKRKNDLEYKAKFENLDELELWELAEAKGVIMAHIVGYENKPLKEGDWK